MDGAVTNKHRMYELLNGGAFGHTLPAVEDLASAEALLANSKAEWAVRAKKSGGNCTFGLSPAAALDLVRSLPPGSWNLSPMLSDPHRVCYGHLYDRIGGWTLHYSDEPKACRLKYEQDGCKQSWLDGLNARLYLRRIMDQRGWDTLTELVDQYPGHVIEFTVMAGKSWAFGPSNTIFWEVRVDSAEYERDTWKWKQFTVASPTPTICG